MANSEDNMDLSQLYDLIQKVLGDHPILREMVGKVKEEQSRMGKVNILIAGKTGVGKSTLVNAVFGESVATTGTGRPVTDQIRWYEPVGLPVRLCDTKGLELADFNKILDDLEAEIKRGISSGKPEDRVHILWLCIAEPGERVEKADDQIIAICEHHSIPAIVVLTKAIGPDSFEATVRKLLLPPAKKVIRVLAEKWGDHHPPFGLEDLVQATIDLLPEATKNAFEAAQRIDLKRKRDRALREVTAAAATAAAAGAAVPVPVADVAVVLSVNIGMIARVSAIMGVQLSMDNIKTIAGSMLVAMATTTGGRLIASQILRLIPGLGNVPAGMIMAAIALPATYGLGYGYTEFLCRFHTAQRRMPAGEEIKKDFRKFWENWGQKLLLPSKDTRKNSPGPESS